MKNLNEKIKILTMENFFAISFVDFKQQHIDPKNEHKIPKPQNATTTGSKGTLVFM